MEVNQIILLILYCTLAQLAQDHELMSPAPLIKSSVHCVFSE